MQNIAGKVHPMEGWTYYDQFCNVWKYYYRIISMLAYPIHQYLFCIAYIRWITSILGTLKLIHNIGTVHPFTADGRTKLTSRGILALRYFFWKKLFLYASTFKIYPNTLIVIWCKVKKNKLEVQLFLPIFFSSLKLIPVRFMAGLKGHAH